MSRRDDTDGRVYVGGLPIDASEREVSHPPIKCPHNDQCPSRSKTPSAAGRPCARSGSPAPRPASPSSSSRTAVTLRTRAARWTESKPHLLAPILMLILLP